ncbi:MAG: urate hydroxylase PuuD [Deltaproteobacteria bacterium]|nr:urate hydroxylase PuuD [Deltaproteobacteria bacterium]
MDSYQVSSILESLFRWIHVVAGILWIGLLYFFNWVNSAFAPTMDGETKKKVVPELMPRTLYWFRWGAAWTWFSGVLLLMLVFYHGKISLADQVNGFTAGAWIMVAATFAGVFVYDLIMNTLGKSNIKAAVILSFVLVVVMIFLYQYVGGFSYRGTTIHVGALFGSCMAFNVWFRIWPAQKKVIPAIKNGEAPDAAAAALAGLRSKHNTYMSVPLVWAMLNTHSTWAASYNLYILPAFIAFGWWVTYKLYKRAAKVPGF